MRKLLGGLTLVSVVALFFFAAFAWAQSQEGPQPVCFMEEMRFDLGEVFEQAKYVHEYKVKNTGNADLQILSVRPG